MTKHYIRMASLVGVCAFTLIGAVRISSARISVIPKITAPISPSQSTTRLVMSHVVGLAFRGRYEAHIREAAITLDIKDVTFHKLAGPDILHAVFGNKTLVLKAAGAASSLEILKRYVEALHRDGGYNVDFASWHHE